MKREWGCDERCNIQDAMKTNSQLRLTRLMCDRLVQRHNILAEEAGKNGVYLPGSAVVAKLRNKSMVRGVVKYATTWDVPNTPDLKRLVSYKLQTDISVMHSEITSAV